MKKLIAIVFSVLMLLSAAACGTENAQTPDAAPGKTPISDGTDVGESSVGEDNMGTGQEYVKPTSGEVELGLYDSGYDYAANPRYKIQYVAINASALEEAFSDSISAWCDLMNMEYLGMCEFGGDKDAFISSLPVLAEAADGLILDPEPLMFDKVAEIMEGTDCHWMPGMYEARDYNTTFQRLNTFVGFNDVQLGSIFPGKLLAMADELWPDVPREEIGFITVDYSLDPALHNRALACEEALAKLAPEMMDNYYVADTAINFFDVETSNEVVSAVMTRHPEIEYWLVFAEFDDMAKGAAAAADTMGLADTTCIAAFGGSSLLTQWDAGIQDSWKVACYLPTSMYTEPIVGALYAFMNGDATPDTLWPNWVDANDHGGEGHNYAARLLPYYWIENHNYKSIVKWGDIYAGTNYYPDYPVGDLTRDSYSTQVAVPESYK